MDETLFPKELIEEVALKNGLVMRLYDCSRRVAGDRWYVCLLAEIEIPVDENILAREYSGPKEDLLEFIEKNGDSVLFQMKKERNFVDEREREGILNNMVDALKGSCTGYMGHSSFGPNYVKKVFEEYLERRNWWKEE